MLPTGFGLHAAVSRWWYSQPPFSWPVRASTGSSDRFGDHYHLKRTTNSVDAGRRSSEPKLRLAEATTRELHCEDKVISYRDCPVAVSNMGMDH